MPIFLPNPLSYPIQPNEINKLNPGNQWGVTYEHNRDLYLANLVLCAIEKNTFSFSHEDFRIFCDLRKYRSGWGQKGIQLIHEELASEGYLHVTDERFFLGHRLIMKVSPNHKTPVSIDMIDLSVGPVEIDYQKSSPELFHEIQRIVPELQQSSDRSFDPEHYPRISKSTHQWAVGINNRACLTTTMLRLLFWNHPSMKYVNVNQV